VSHGRTALRAINQSIAFLNCASRDRQHLTAPSPKGASRFRSHPNYANGHINLGDSLGANGDLDGAIAEYRAAIGAAPNLSRFESHFSSSLMARAHAKLGVAIEKGDRFTVVRAAARAADRRRGGAPASRSS